MSSSTLRRLIYASRWRDPEPASVEEMLQAIIGRSIQNNRLVDVTGLLLYRRGWFLQALEGRSDCVRQTFERIRLDPRHTAVHVISDEAAERRAFADWNMVATPLEALTPEGMDGLDPDDVTPPARLAPATALRLMQAAGAAELRREREALLGGRAA